MFGVAAVVSHIGSAPVETPQINAEVGFCGTKFIVPKALGAASDLVTSIEILMLPPAPLGFPGGFGGAELPSYWAVILTKPPMSSFKPLPFASKGLNLPGVAENKPAIGEVVSLLIKAAKAIAICSLFSLANPLAGARSVVS